MKKSTLLLAAFAISLGAYAKGVTATWQLSDPDNLAQVSVTGGEDAKALVTPSFTKGDKIGRVRAIANSGAESGFQAVTYEPNFTAYTTVTTVNAKTAGYCVTVAVAPQTGHKFKPKTVSFDAIKVGTDGGGMEVWYKAGDAAEAKLGNASPLRNKVNASNPNAFSHHEFTLSDVIVDGKPFAVSIYFMGINGQDKEESKWKELGLRNVVIDGTVDEEIFTVGDFVKRFTCSGTTAPDKTETLDLTTLIAGLKHGQSVTYGSKLFGQPSDFKFEMAEGYTADYVLNQNELNVNIKRGNESILEFAVRFVVTNRQPKPEAKPLNRGLMALSLTGAKMGTGNLVSWRHREADGYGVKYKLYRGTEDAQDEVLNAGLYIIDRTNYEDKDGTADSYYRLETYDKTGKLLETEVSRKTWNDQTFRIPINAPAKSAEGADYSPNDASFCDMDGDGEYEIILKWSPSNEKDAASSGTTSPAIFDCYKLDGTQLWRINAGPNFFTSAHTMQFIAWDFDGDGYGEFMMKTGPGTVDGEGNYVVMGNDDPTANWLNGRGKQVEGPEYITVFDGLTGAALSTIPYHTNYKAGEAVWGDDKQNRSERYLAGLAYLDGPDANPSPIFARGYYSGAFVGAYDWDGVQLKERWVSRNTTKGQGLWGEGAHWMACGDCDGDGRHEIVYGSAALDHDGTLLYRTGLGHGDAMHLGDLLPEREGLELFMVHEGSSGYDLRDAATGELLLRQAPGGDTGRGIAAHFDASSTHSQFSHSSEPGMHDCLTGELLVEGWNPGGGGSMNNRIYWTGDLYDEHYDKSVIAKWNGAGWDRVQVNKTNYTVGTLNNYTKYNPCVLGDLLGDWREEIVLWERGTNGTFLVINATSYPTEYRIPAPPVGRPVGQICRQPQPRTPGRRWRRLRRHRGYYT